MKLAYWGQLTILALGGILASSGLVASERYSIREEALTAHNQWRVHHHAPKLIWDDALQHYAEKHASSCVFKHSACPYGENLAAGYSSVTAAVNAWYAEHAQYSYQHPRYSQETGHFTQLVWVASKRVGCADVACNGKNGTPGHYWVCEYSPAGNVTNDGYFKRNVLPAKA